MFAEKIGKQLGHPTRSVVGWLVTKYLAVFNRFLEENAVQLTDIQPGETVLELGHGPGLGLQAAAKLLTDPSGHLIGVDLSKYMHRVASELMKELVASGKVTLYNCDLTAMPLPDSTVDKVFHCNCYYFWPDLRKAATEIHRVMKPGGLMVTTLRLSFVAASAAKQLLPEEGWQPKNYIAALTDSGFTDVRMEEKQHKHINFQVIYATASK